MQRAFDRPGQQENRTQWTAAIAGALVMLAMAALVSSSTTASNWVSDAAQAELASSNVTPPEQAPVQIAQPAKPIRTVRAE
jgi:hypothetical protein